MICERASSEDLCEVSFNCGQDGIDSYYREKLLTDNDAVPYCFWTDGQKQELVGIASLSCSGIIIQSKNHFNVTPAIEVKIFAIDEKYQHQPFPDDDCDSLHWSDYCLYYFMQKLRKSLRIFVEQVILYYILYRKRYHSIVEMVFSILLVIWKNHPIYLLTAVYRCSLIYKLGL